MSAVFVQRAVWPLRLGCVLTGFGCSLILLIIINAFIFLTDQPLPLLRQRGAGLGAVSRQRSEYVTLNRVGPGTLQRNLQLCDVGNGAGVNRFQGGGPN